MDIVARLKLFLQQSGLSNSQFADNCDIPRPSLSQLLNGRNKKVSDEVLAKIHRSYPHLNIMWLMFGDGEMYVPNANSAESADFAQPAESTASGDAMGSGSGAKSRGNTITFGDDAAYSGAPRTAAPRQTVNPLEAMQRMARMAPQAPARVGKEAADERRVVSIMVLYSDGRFETFTPQ